MSPSKKPGTSQLLKVPPKWTDADLSAASNIALEAFVKERLTEGTGRYETLLVEMVPQIEALFVATADLANISGAVFTANQALVEVARWIGGPPVSRDDLKTLVGGNPGNKAINKGVAEHVARTLVAVRDPVRFPWVSEKRIPTAAERRAAILWTAGLFAVERTRTKRRGESSKRQEDAVELALTAAKFKKVVPPARNITQNDQLERGTFTRQVHLDRSECDVLARLGDGRLLAIECKVSNTAVNSIKRLGHETGNKARKWNDAFGKQVVTAAVLAGVFALGKLSEAQNENKIFLLWEHDLGPLTEFSASTL
jgi:hypothetical protein